MKKILATVAVALATIVGVLVGVSTANAATTKPECVTLIHYQHLNGNAGYFTAWISCGGGHYKFRARAECFPDSGHGKPEWRSGSWRTANFVHSTAGCTNGYYLDNGGYNHSTNPNHYYVLWRYSGVPV